MNFSQLRPGEVFFSAPFWLPPNVTWEVFEQYDKGKWRRFPGVDDIFVAWRLVPVILILKYVMEKYVTSKIGVWAGIKDEPRVRPPNVELLEKAHRTKAWARWSDLEISALTKQLDWSEEQVREWLKARRKFELPSTIEKFSESSWRCLFFICILAYGLYVHWSKAWFWDIKLCFKDYPQPVPEDMYWYFVISLANYSAWNISQFWDVPRKDPKLLMFHHLAAVFLLWAMWIAGAYRLGLYTCLIHDVGDVLLEGSKCLKYLDLLRTDEPWFYAFSVVSSSLWIVTRNFILPFRILPCIYYDAPFNIPQTFPFSCLYGPCDIRFTMCHTIMTILASMSFLHLYWTGIIFKIAYMAFFVGKFKDDTRAVSDGEDEDPTQKLKSKIKKILIHQKQLSISCH